MTSCLVAVQIYDGAIWGGDLYPTYKVPVVALPPVAM